jgi:hypothetical protein
MTDPVCPRGERGEKGESGDLGYVVPIAETVTIGEAYSCSRSLFSFVNRSLNLIELQARVEHIKNDTVIFRVVQRAGD